MTPPGPSLDERSARAAHLLLQRVLPSRLRPYGTYTAAGYFRFLSDSSAVPAAMSALHLHTLSVAGEVAAVADWRVRDGRVLFLNGMTVADDHRGQGLARRLLAAGLTVAEGAGLTTVELDVLADNTAARSLYRSAGFTDTQGRSYWWRRAGWPAPAEPVVVTNWATAYAAFARYGFCDVTARVAGTIARVRLVNAAGRVPLDGAGADAAGLSLPAALTPLVGELDVCYVSPTAPPEAAEPLGEFHRWRRPV